MDDAQHKQALDELAEVFLTGTDHTPETTQTPDAQPSPAAPTELRLSGVDEENEQHDTHEDTPRSPIGHEAVILGNLPGLGGAWLGQYAQHLADEHGPVGVLHLDHDAVDLEVVGEQPGSGMPGRVPPANRERDDLTHALDELATQQKNPLARLLVHVEPYQQGEINTHDAARLAAFDRWTFLCGADDPAIVACYRMIKHLLEASQAPGPRRIGLMILGCSEIEGLEAARKIQAAAQSHLNRPVDLVGTLARMRPVRTRPVGRFSPVDRMWLRLRGWIDDLQHDELPQPQTPAEHDEQHSGEHAMSQAPHTHAEPLETGHAPDDALEIELELELDQDAQHNAPTGTARATRIGKLAQPMPRPNLDAPAQQPASQTDEPDIVTLMIENPDLGLHDAIRMDATCPHQPEVAMLLDARGRLHLVRTHRRTPRSAVADNSQNDLAEMHQALLDLADARRWARQHIQLLQLTQRQCRFDLEARPVMHLATERANLGLELTRRLGNALKLHLLQHVRIANLTGWHLTPLS